MNLRDQLRQILPEILSENPSNCIKGTELIRLVKYRLNQDYSDATLRYHFSIMSCDPSSPIAKVEQGQGYFLRTTTIHSLNSARNLLPNRQGLLGEEIATSSQDVDLALSRANKFRAVFCRYNELAHRFPFPLEKSFSEGEAIRNLWTFPDALLLDWHVAHAGEESFEMDPDLLEICGHSGSSPFTLTGVKMKLSLTHSSVREDFFQCLSNTLWSHAGEMVVATPLTDEKLVEDLRSLGTRFNLGILSYGLDLDTLDELPEAAAIRSLQPREFDAIESKITIHRITSATPRTDLSWHQLAEIRQESPDFEEIFKWISKCLRDRQPYTYQAFSALSARSANRVSGAELYA